MRRYRVSRSGISLVEVLMVIAVIAILAGILLPVLTRTKVQSRKAKCASNLHQLGRAFHLYVSDWNGVYPAPGGRPGDGIYWAQSGRGGIVRYVGRNGGVGTVWCCPELTKWQGRYEARSYSMNSFLRNPPDTPHPQCTWAQFQLGVAEVIVEDPRRTILLYEGMHVTMDWPGAQDYVYRCANWKYVRGSGWFTREQPCLHTENSWLPWHEKENNYLYCDGHVVARVPGPRVKAELSTLEEMYEWFVLKSVTGPKYAKLLEW